MRTTVDLPPEVHARAKRLATERGESLSATVSDLTVRGLASLGQPASISIRSDTGFPVLSLAEFVTQPITSDDVARALDEE